MVEKEIEKINEERASYNLNSTEYEYVFTELIGNIGDASSGGNSVEDIHLERQRV
ncbi:MAG: hypothetical protein HZA20_10720 [Nitrospirae bacterium]|nr:hypothetical protein [Nitrospirota bacterium]